MTRLELIKQCMIERKKTLDTKSKWYHQDMADFKEQISRFTLTELRDKLDRLKYLNSPHFDKACNKEIRRLDKAGMFDIGRMRPENMLD